MTRSEKLKLYPYTLGLHQLESIIILIDVFLHVLVTQFCKTLTCTFCTYVSKKCNLMQIKTCVSSILCNEVKELIIVDH